MAGYQVALAKIPAELLVSPGTLVKNVAAIPKQGQQIISIELRPAGHGGHLARAAKPAVDHHQPVIAIILADELAEKLTVSSRHQIAAVSLCSGLNAVGLQCQHPSLGHPAAVGRPLAGEPVGHP